MAPFLSKRDLQFQLFEVLDTAALPQRPRFAGMGIDAGEGQRGPLRQAVGERGGVPHHLLDIWEVTRTASVAEPVRISARWPAPKRWPVR